VSISDDIQDTVAQLDNLHAGERARKAETFAGLQAIVANLDTIIPPLVPDYDPIEPLFRRREEPRQAPEVGDGFGEVPISRPKPFHRFGPQVEAKLIAEALKKPNW
jgi:hypothetical protein